MYLLYDPLILRNARAGRTDGQTGRYSVNVPARSSPHRLYSTLYTAFKNKKKKNIVKNRTQVTVFICVVVLVQCVSVCISEASLIRDL